MSRDILVAIAQDLNLTIGEGNSNGGVPWQTAQHLAQQFVSQMTPEEQNNITYGYSADNGCVGVSGPISRLNFPGFCLADSGNGLRGTDLVTGFASGQSYKL